MSAGLNTPEADDLLAGFAEWYRTCPARGPSAELAAKAAFRHFNARPKPTVMAEPVVVMPPARPLRAPGAHDYNAGLLALSRQMTCVSIELLRRITQECTRAGHYRDQREAVEELREQLEYAEKYKNRQAPGLGQGEV